MVYDLTDTVLALEILNLDYVQPGNGVEETVAGVDLDTLCELSISSNSAATTTTSTTSTKNTTTTTTTSTTTTTTLPDPPTVSSATISANGQTLTIEFDKAVTFGAGGNGGFDVDG